MAFSIVASSGGASGTGSATTPSFDSTGANLLIALGSYYHHASGQTLTDSKGNSWTALTQRVSGSLKNQIWYSTNSPTVGSGHTVSITGNAGAIYPVINVIAVSGAHATAPFGGESNNTFSSATSVAAGSLTPSENDALLVASLTGQAANTYGVNSGYAISSQVSYSAGNNMGGAAAYLIQGSAAAVNPTFSWSTSDSGVTSTAWFKSDGAGGGGTANSWYYRQQMQRLAGA